MPRVFLQFVLFLGLICLVSSLDVTSSETVTSTPAPDLPEEDSEFLDPVKVLLDAAAALEENVASDTSSTLNGDSFSTILESDGNEMDKFD